jgi:hypothetical protein
MILCNISVCLISLQIFVNGEFCQHVRSPQRTKSLLSGLHQLDNPGTIEVSIRSINHDAEMSQPAVTRIAVRQAPENNELLEHVQDRTRVDSQLQLHKETEICRESMC